MSTATTPESEGIPLEPEPVPTLPVAEAPLAEPVAAAPEPLAAAAAPVAVMPVEEPVAVAPAPVAVVPEAVPYASPAVATAKPARLASLDIFRGMTIAGMLLVNNPGPGGPYDPLEHAPWNGWTPTDLVFPFFAFIMGVAI